MTTLWIKPIENLSDINDSCRRNEDLRLTGLFFEWDCSIARSMANRG